MYKNVEDFIKYNTTEKDICHYYKKYNKEVQKMLKNIYSCCFRFSLYKSQIIFMLNSALESFKVNEDEEMLGLR